MKNIFKFCALLWADILLEYTIFFMQNYLTDAWKISFTHAAAIVNIWCGLFRILPFFLLFLADEFLGNFVIMMLSAISTCVGIASVAVSTLPVFGTCKQEGVKCSSHPERALFYTGMTLLAVGRAAHLATLDSFAEEQKSTEATEKRSGIKILSLVMMITPLIVFFAFPYVKVWPILFGVSAICIAAATLFYLSGWRTYDDARPEGRAVTSVFRVFVAAARKISVPDSEQLYIESDDEVSFSHTRFLRCLEKAAIILPDSSLDDQKLNKWKLCSVGEVEAAKFAVRAAPMLATFIICSIASSAGNTYFAEQATHMNTTLGKWKIGPQGFLLMLMVAKRLGDNYRAALLPRLGPSIGIGVAMVFSVLCFVSAARIEERRLRTVRRHALVDKPNDTIPMSALFLVLQFVLLGGMDSFFEKSVEAFYKEQSPASMGKYLDVFGGFASGLGYMCSVALVYVVGRISEVGGRPNWFQYTLNKSHLERYYWLLAALTGVNLLVFLLVASSYRYKEQPAIGGGAIKPGDRPKSLSDTLLLMIKGFTFAGVLVPEKTARFMSRYLR